MTIITTKGVFDTRTGRAGAAAKIENEISQRVAFFGGTINAEGPTLADLAAMQEGIQYGIDAGIIERMSRLEIRTNCRECIAILLAKVPASRCIGSPFVERAKKINGRVGSSPALAEIVRLVSSHHLAIVLRVGMDDEVIGRARAAMTRTLEVAP